MFNHSPSASHCLSLSAVSDWMFSHFQCPDCFCSCGMHFMIRIHTCISQAPLSFLYLPCVSVQSLPVRLIFVTSFPSVYSSLWIIRCPVLASVLVCLPVHRPLPLVFIGIACYLTFAYMAQLLFWILLQHCCPSASRCWPLPGLWFQLLHL